MIAQFNSIIWNVINMYCEYMEYIFLSNCGTNCLYITENLN